MTKILKGKVIGFINKDPYKVIINIGIDQEIKVGMPFIIYYEGEEVIDPDTKEELGKLEYIKAKVKVSHVAEKYSILESNEFEVDQYPFFGKQIANVFKDITPTHKKRPLNLSGNEEEEKIPIEKINIGDLVRSDPSRE